MSISSFIRGAGRGVVSVGRAVQNASRKLDETVAGQPHPMSMTPQLPVGAAPGAGAAPSPSTTAPAAPVAGPPAPEGTPAPSPAPAPAAPASGQPPAQGTPAPEAKAPKGFSLPDIGPAPDQNDPKYASDKGKEAFQRDQEDYQHKQDIHQAFQDLDKIYSQAHPSRDFQKEYEDAIAMKNQHEKDRPGGSTLARFALALGDQNPAIKQSGRSNLDEYNQNVDKAAARSDQSFSQRLALRMKMHESAAADAEEAGNWKKALAENEKLALLKADDQALQHKRDMEKVGVQQEGATNRANIRADAMEKSAKIRTDAIGGAHNLTGTFLTAFQKQAAAAVAKLLGPRDLTKDYSPADLDSITTYVEHLAEMFHDQQYGDGSSETYLGTHPKKRKPAQSDGTKPTF